MDPLQLMDALEEYHPRCVEELDAVERLLSARRSPEPILSPWRRLRDKVRHVVAKEESVVFPAVRALYRGEPHEAVVVGSAIGVMEIEHEELHQLQEIIRLNAGLAGPVSGRVETFLDELGTHLARQDRELFPAVLERASI